MERTAGQRDSELVRQTAELLSSAAPLSDLFEQFCLLLAQFVDASVVFIALATDDGVHLEFAYDHGRSSRDAHVPVQPESQTARVMQSGEPLLMRTPDDFPTVQIPLQIPGASQEDAASAIFVPLRFGLRPVGVLSVQSRTPYAYDEHDLQLLETCALYVAVRVQAELHRENHRTAADAALDRVTGVAKRRVFEERLDSEWQRARRIGGSITVILLDVDRFRSFNDTFGHVAGDACLAQIAQAGRLCVSRRGDLFARYGGQAFAAIVRDVAESGALAIAERMRAAVCALQIPHARSPQGIVTVSCGVATVAPASDDPRALLRAADRALYAAKCAGRNRTVLDAAHDLEDEPHTGGNLPVSTSQTIGRAIELDALARCLAISRLTTVAGAAGVGKTQCALAVADQLARAYVHGAWFFDLSDARDPADVDAALAAQLYRRHAGYLHARDAVLQYFASKHCLIVLDHCTRAAAALCEALLAHAPRVTILATARESLKARGERVFHLSPLTGADAQALFCARAENGAAGAIFDAREREHIRAICGRLNNVPQAIELVAPRAGALSASAVAAALEDRDCALEAAIAWSYAQLDDRAQRLFERLSVFAGSFDGEAARDICGFAPLRPGEAAAAFEELVDRRLVQSVHVYDERRFVLPHAVASYAAEQLRARGEERHVQLRHAKYYLAFARRLVAQMRGDGAERALEGGARESRELRIALERMFAQPEHRGTACDLVLTLCDWWAVSGRTREARRWIDAALEAVRPGTSRRAQLLYAATLVAQSDGDFPALLAFASELLAIEQHSDDRARLGRACSALGTAERHLGNAKASEQWYTSALAHHRAAGDRLAAAAELMNLGAVAADLHLDFDAARTHVFEALRIFREFSVAPGIATALAKLGEVSAFGGDYESAIAYAAESLSIFERLRSGCSQAWQLASISQYRLERREWERAACALRDAHALLQEHPHREYTATMLEAAFALACELERHELAAKIAGHLHAYREREAVPRPPSVQRQYDRRLQRARAKLGTGPFEAAFAAGRLHAMDSFVADIVRP